MSTKEITTVDAWGQPRTIRQHSCDGCGKLWTEGQPEGHWVRVRDETHTHWRFLCPDCEKKRDPLNLISPEVPT